MIETGVNPLSLVDPVLSAIREVATDEPRVLNVASMDQYVDRALAVPRFRVFLAALLGTCALAVSVEPRRWTRSTCCARTSGRTPPRKAGGTNPASPLDVPSAYADDPSFSRKPIL